MIFHAVSALNPSQAVRAEEDLVAAFALGAGAIVIIQIPKENTGPQAGSSRV